MEALSFFTHRKDNPPAPTFGNFAHNIDILIGALLYQYLYLRHYRGKAGIPRGLVHYQEDHYGVGKYRTGTGVQSEVHR